MRDRFPGSNEQNFESIERSAVPTNRKSKHHQIVEKNSARSRGTEG